MSSNFEFIKSEWPEIFEAAVSAEKHTITAPRTCAFYCRYALERTVYWLYEHDKSLRKPYQEKLAALIHEDTFVRNLGNGLFNRVRYIHNLGNHAAHSGGRIRDIESMTSLKHLFAFLCWLTRTYSKNPPKDILFKESIIPKTGQEEKTAKQLQQLHEQLAQKDKQLEEQRQEQAQYLEQIEQLRKQIREIKVDNLKSVPAVDYTEEETRDLFIDLMLREAGWHPGSPDLSEEYKVTGMPGKSGTGYVDYVLWGNDGLPLAVVEAKNTRRSSKDGEHQAKLYADCLEKSKGQRPVIFCTNGYETWLWDDTFYPPRPVQGFYSKDELQLLINRRKTRKPLETMAIDENIVDRPYHIEGIRRVTETFGGARRKALVVMATGAGKTRFSIALVKLLMQANWVRRVLFLADRITLVRQAKNYFKELYPHASTVNLLEEKENDKSRIVFSTYPTMLNSIDETRGRGEKERKRFGVGHFDLVIIDEAHRSVYLKYKAIFEYFDSLLLGLTATPKAEVDRNTYHLFDLEDHMPTFYYELDKAVKDGYLVPPRAMAVPLKFPQQGIRYDELSEEDKEEYEARFYDDETGSMPEYIDANAVNQWLFNADTVDKVLAHLMEFGCKIKGGDKLGKTIIFAKNHKHALFIKERFDKIFPNYKGKFLQVIDHFVEYAQNRIDNFAMLEKDPVIAVSVDMLDTGIDIHEIVNLAFFKIVRSKVKFWQMIGRGTRTCKNLFGPGKDKENFIIFDFCANFEFFAVFPEGISPSQLEPLTQQIFKKRLFLAHLLNDPQNRVIETDRRFHQFLLDILHRDVKNLDPARFYVRPHRKYVEKYSRRERWEKLEITDISDISEQLSRLMRPADNDEIARRFDLLILNLQLSMVEKTEIRHKLMSHLQKLAAALSRLGSIPAVMARMERIQSILTDTFKYNATLWELEEVRQELRDLIRLIDIEKQAPVYTDFEDIIGPAVEITGIVQPDENLNDYREKVEAYVRNNQEHITIYRLKHNLPITGLELEELERMLFENSGLERREDLVRVFGTERPLGRFIRSVVGMDRSALNDAFAAFLSGSTFTGDQITFINYVLEYLSRKGYMEKGSLLEQPFTDLHYQGPYGLFASEEVNHIIQIIDTINANAVAV
jgi:type I restriction enzyme R subunit